MSTYSWNNPSGGAFDNAGNWVPNTAFPGPSDTADFLIAGSFTVDGDGSAQYIDIADTATFTGTITATGPAYPDFTSVYISGGAAIFDGGGLDALSEIIVGGLGGAGLLALLDGAGGTLTATNSATALDIGYDYGGHAYAGTVTVDGPRTALTILGGAYVGVFSPGTLSVTDGASVQVLASTASYDTFEAGLGAGAPGTIKVDTGATLSIDETSYFGEDGEASISFSNGASGIFNDYTTVGDRAGSAGTVSIASGATATFEGVSPFGGGGQASSVYLGDTAGSRGIITVDGTATTVTANEGVDVGFNGDGTLQLTNGAALSIEPATPNGPFSVSAVGLYSGATGTLLVSGGAQITGTGEWFVGEGGYGSIDISSGAAIISNLTTGNADGLGLDAGGVGVGTIDAATWSSDQSFFVGFDGSGTLTVRDSGTLDVGPGFLRVGRDYGSSGTLTVDNSAINAGNATLTVGPDNAGTLGASGGTGTLALQDGATATVGSAVIAGLATGFGSLDVTGSRSQLYLLSGSLTTGAGSSYLSVENNGKILANGAAVIGGGGGSALVAITDHGELDAYGGVTIAALGTLAIDPTAGFVPGSTIMLAGGTFSALGNDSPGYGVEIVSGTKAAPSAIIGTPGSDMLLSQGVTFASGASAALLLGPAFDTGNIITNFAAGDRLDVRISPTVFNTASYDTGTGNLTLSVVADAPLVLHLANNGYSATSFSAFADGTGGTDVVLGPPCYLAGTRILTDHGEVAVEDLVIGDRLITRTGQARALRWIGMRSYDPRFAASNPDILPVLIGADAIAAGIPRRDLYVSPRHAIYLDNTLIPAASLVNGTTIVRARKVAEITYYHLELATHDIIFADGAASESYIDLDNRDMFHNAAEYATLYGESSAAARKECAPRCETGLTVTAIRSRLAERAAALGHKRRDMQMVTLHDVGVTRTCLGAGVTEVQLRSAAGFAAGDRRPLGALLRAVSVDGVAIALDGPALQRGFHPAEQHGMEMLRWTNGDAMLTLPPAATERWIAVDVAAMMQTEQAA